MPCVVNKGSATPNPASVPLSHGIHAQGAVPWNRWTVRHGGGQGQLEEGAHRESGRTAGAASAAGVAWRAAASRIRPLGVRQGENEVSRLMPALPDPLLCPDRGEHRLPEMRRANRRAARRRGTHPTRSCGDASAFRPRQPGTDHQQRPLVHTVAEFRYSFRSTLRHPNASTIQRNRQSERRAQPRTPSTAQRLPVAVSQAGGAGEQVDADRLSALG